MFRSLPCAEELIGQSATGLDAISHNELIERVRTELALIHRKAEVEYLCALGARKNTIKNLVPGVVQNNIKERTDYWHPDVRRKKHKALDYYTETRERRRDSGMILATYQRLLKEKLPAVATFVQLHHIYRRERTAAEPMDIDELIALTIHYTVGEIKIEICPHCGMPVVMQLRERYAQKVCSWCESGPKQRARKRMVDTGPDIVLPAAEQIQTIADKMCANSLNSLRLVLCAARPAEIEQMIPGMEREAAEQWGRIFRRPSPSGHYPSTPNSCVDKAERRRHSAFVIMEFERLKNTGLSEIELVITVFRLYLAAFGATDDTLHFSRIRKIITFYLQGLLRLHECPDCKARYALLRDELLGDQTCPTCRGTGQAMVESPYRRLTPDDSDRLSIYLAPLPGDVKRRRVARLATNLD